MKGFHISLFYKRASLKEALFVWLELVYTGSLKEVLSIATLLVATLQAPSSQAEKSVVDIY